MQAPVFIILLIVVLLLRNAEIINWHPLFEHFQNDGGRKTAAFGSSVSGIGSRKMR
jgi:hypothetical protein